MTTPQISNVTVAGHAGHVDISWADGLITSIAPTADPEGGWGGRFAFSGYVDAHLHLDKAHILDRTMGGEGGLADAIGKVRAAKRGFTIHDVQDRAARVLDSAIVHGTTLMRSFVEVDPDAGLRSFDALAELKSSYSDRIDLRLSAFAQDGTTQTPETLALLRKALADGADEVGGCPYTDSDPQAHIRTILDLAEEFNVPADFHVDFDLDPSWEHTSLILDEVERRDLRGRVTIGHATKLTALVPEGRKALADRLREAAVGLVVLPATDLFLVGKVVPPDIARALATNNVCNPFTPYGDADLLRMAHLYSIVARMNSDQDLHQVWRMITSQPAEMLADFNYLVETGHRADIVVIDAPDPIIALRELRQPLAGWKAGRPTFTHPAAVLH